MEKYNRFTSILTNVNILRYIIVSKVKLGYYDINKQVENFYKDLLNKVYKWDLENKNTSTKNYPGIDLGSSLDRIAVQVTSQKNSTKIDKTLELFDAHHLADYDRLIIFIITAKANYTKTFNSKVLFDKDADIIDVDDLLAEIEKKTTIEISDIANYIEKEIPYYIGKLTTEKDILHTRTDYANILPKNYVKFEKIFEDESAFFEDFKELSLQFHKKLLSISQIQRKGVLVFFTKCDRKKISLDISTWGGILETSFSFKRSEVIDLLALLESKHFFYNDEDHPPCLQVKPNVKDYWLTIYEVLNDDEIHDLIMNVNFSVLDK